MTLAMQTGNHGTLAAEVEPSMSLATAPRNPALLLVPSRELALAREGAEGGALQAPPADDAVALTQAVRDVRASLAALAVIHDIPPIGCRKLFWTYYKSQLVL